MPDDNDQSNKCSNINNDNLDHSLSQHMTEASELKGFIVVAKSECKLLGEVSQIFLDPKEHKITALQLKTWRWRKDKHFIPVAEVEIIGQDVILVKDIASCKTNDFYEPNWLSLKDLQGNWITTMEGTHLGTLIDVDFSTDDWVVSHLFLSGHKVMKIDPSEIVFGKDELVVPTHYADCIQKQKQPGFLHRLFGEESFAQVSKAVSRSTKNSNSK